MNSKLHAKLEAIATRLCHELADSAIDFHEDNTPFTDWEELENLVSWKLHLEYRRLTGDSILYNSRVVGLAANAVETYQAELPR